MFHKDNRCADKFRHTKEHFGKGWEPKPRGGEKEIVFEFE